MFSLYLTVIKMLVGLSCVTAGYFDYNPPTTGLGLGVEIFRLEFVVWIRRNHLDIKTSSDTILNVTNHWIQTSIQSYLICTGHSIQLYMYKPSNPIQNKQEQNPIAIRFDSIKNIDNLFSIRLNLKVSRVRQILLHKSQINE